MSDMYTQSEAIHQHGDAHALAAAGLTTAANGDQAASIAAAVPLFGQIGQTFLAAFAQAQSNHVAGVNQLAAVHSGIAAASHQGVASYEAVEGASASGMGALGTSL